MVIIQFYSVHLQMSRPDGTWIYEVMSVYDTHVADSRAKAEEWLQEDLRYKPREKAVLPIGDKEAPIWYRWHDIDLDYEVAVIIDPKPISTE